MSYFPYRDGVMHAEGVPLDRLADEVGTPFFCYSSGALEAAYLQFADALRDLDPLICYAVKANGNLAVVRTLAQLGAGADVVSEGELRRALAAGVPAEHIVFAGVGKTPAEMAFALDAGIFQFNVESLPELEALNQVAMAKGQMAPVALRINPDVDARTHAKISTGKAENKFGIAMNHCGEALERGRDMQGIDLKGLAVHIGSQLTDIAPYRQAFERLVSLYREAQASGFSLSRLDFGGGLGIVYREEAPADLAGYAAVVREATRGLTARFIFEPGRLLVGNAGLLVTRVLYVKGGATRQFVIVDAAMNDLIRPSLYDAWHDIVPIAVPKPEADTMRVDIVGPICETGDSFAEDRPLPPVAPGDLLAICSSGAYAAVMASSYNARPVAPEVMVKGKNHAVVRQRPDHATLISQDSIPAWLETLPLAAK